jgi:hypothetical protein
MIRLFVAELRRIMARRLVRVTVALTVLGIALGGLLAFVRTSSISDATYQQRVVEAKAREEAQRAQIDACLRAHNVTGDGNIPDAVARQCFPNKPSASAHDPRFHRSRLKDVLQGVSGALAVAGWALGASLIGAEFASRGITTLLTWESRRGRVFLTKAVAIVAVVSVFALGTLVFVALAMWPALALHGGPLRVNDPSIASLAGVVARGVAVAALSAGMGLALATIGRNTAAALGAGFAYIIVLENILGNSIANWRRWLLLGNVIVFISGRNNGSDVPGRSVTGAGLFLTAVALGLLAVAATAFYRRDVT